MKNILQILKGYGELTDGIYFDAVIRHPLSDEFEWLEKLDVKPENCDSCDILWAFEDKIVFVAIFSTNKRHNQSYVLYKFDDEARNGGDHFNVATLQTPLKKAHINKALRFLSEWLGDKNNEIRKSKPLTSVQIEDFDICK